MQRVIIFGLLSALSVGQGVMVAQSVSESALGAWTLNRAKSTFSGAVPERRVTKFEVVGDAIKETTYTMSSNKQSVIVEYHRAIRRQRLSDLEFHSERRCH